MTATIHTSVVDATYSALGAPREYDQWSLMDSDDVPELHWSVVPVRIAPGRFWSAARSKTSVKVYLFTDVPYPVDGHHAPRNCVYVMDCVDNVRALASHLLPDPAAHAFSAAIWDTTLVTEEIAYKQLAAYRAAYPELARAGREFVAGTDVAAFSVVGFDEMGDVINKTPPFESDEDWRQELRRKYTSTPPPSESDDKFSVEFSRAELHAVLVSLQMSDPQWNSGPRENEAVCRVLEKIETAIEGVLP